VFIDHHFHGRDGMRKIAVLRTFLVFFVGGLLLATAVVSAVMMGAAIWVDCFDDDPLHACGDGILLAAVMPFYSIVIAMFVGFMPLIVGAILAALGRAFFRHPPLWYAIAILPICVLAWLANGSPWFPSEAPHAPSLRLLMVVVFQAAALLICWWWERRMDRPRRVFVGLDP
jgi:hypothetical protein